MLKKDPRRTVRLVLSEEGLTNKAILRELSASASKEILHGKQERFQVQCTPKVQNTQSSIRPKDTR